MVQRLLHPALAGLLLLLAACMPGPEAPPTTPEPAAVERAPATADRELPAPPPLPPDDPAPGQGDASERDPTTPQPADALPEPEEDPQPRRKRHPGHYIALNDWDGDRELALAAQPGVVGVHKRYAWADLEPQFDLHDFSGVEADLDLAARLGLRFVLMVEDKSFSMDIRRTPTYLHDRHTLPYIDGGWVARRWHPFVLERLAELTRRLGERFDSHPAFEGIAFQETAMGFTPEIQASYGYTPEAYRDALIRMLKTTRAHFPRSQVFWYMNFLEGRQAYLADVAEVAREHDIAMGGPDVLPDSWPLSFHTYPLYERFAGRMTLFNSIQYDSYRHRHLDPNATTTYWTPEALFLFARDRLHVDYLFWTRNPRRDPPDSHVWTDALPVIAAHPLIRQGEPGSP